MIKSILWLSFLAALYSVYSILLRRRYLLEESSDEIIYVDSVDGWRIPLFRSLPKGDDKKKYPVLLCHGLTGGRRNLDFDEKYSLARFLAARGYDCFAIELRGGRNTILKPGATAGRWRYDFDDYVNKDIPAAIAKIRRITGCDKVHWVGHSMGGMIMYAYQASKPEAVQSAAVLGSPVYFEELNAFFRLGLRFRSLLQVLPVAPLGALLRPTFPLMGRGANAFLNNQTNPKNVDVREFRRFAFNSVDNVSMDVMMQMADFAATGKFAGRDGTDYRAAVAEMKIPTLVFASEKDQVAGFENVTRGHDLIGTEDKKLIILSPEHGTRNHYGHMDMVCGKNVKSEVFEHVAEWLDNHGA